jgi:dTDP-glucose pyrophosphorylase
MRLLILAAGEGTRLGVQTSKCLAGRRPLIFNSLDLAHLNEVNAITIVIGRHCDDVVNMVGTRYMGRDITYCYQDDRTGLIDAIRASGINEDFILSLGDEWMKGPRRLQRKGIAAAGVVFGISAEIKKTYSVVADIIHTANGSIEILRHAEEKPKDPEAGLIGTGYCYFSKAALEYLPEVTDGLLVSWLNLLAKDDGRVYLQRVSSRYLNVNTPEELKEYNDIFDNLG